MTPSPNVVEKALESFRLLDPAAALVARHAVDGHGGGVLVDPEQRVETVVEQDLACTHGDGADGDEAIGARIQARRLGVEHNEANLIDGRVVGPRGLEGLVVAA